MRSHCIFMLVLLWVHFWWPKLLIRFINNQLLWRPNNWWFCKEFSEWNSLLETASEVTSILMMGITSLHCFSIEDAEMGTPCMVCINLVQHELLAPKLNLFPLLYQQTHGNPFAIFLLLLPIDKKDWRNCTFVPQEYLSKSNNYVVVHKGEVRGQEFCGGMWWNCCCLSVC